LAGGFRVDRSHHSIFVYSEISVNVDRPAEATPSSGLKH
jgi:hypothetical protein